VSKPGAVLFRPSYSATTLNCPGSLRASLDAPDTAGYDAAVGTVFHELIAHWQLVGRRPGYLLGQTRSIQGHEVQFDEEMFTFAAECLDHYARLPGERHVEVKVDISSLTPIANQTGTADLIIAKPGVLHIIDWKYGTGVQVFAKHNSQGLCYAWGAFERFDPIYDFDTIHIHIAQPRLDHYDEWRIGRADLYEFAEWARTQWDEAWSGKASRMPSPKACQWCRVKVTCPANQALLEAIADDTFDVLEEGIAVSPGDQLDPAPVIKFTGPAELDTARLAWIYQYRRLVETWFRLIGEELLARGLAGEDLGDWKIGQGRQGRREWIDEDEAAEALGEVGLSAEQLWLRYLASPAQAEKWLRAIGIKGDLNKRFLAALTVRANGKPTLMPCEDNRRSLDEVADESFQ
jgi:hypothetical protein